MSVQLFLSAVSDEFRSYRDLLRASLQRHNVTVHVQEDFVATGTETLDKLDAYIKDCDAVIHLAGDMVGALAQRSAVDALKTRYPDLAERLPPLQASLGSNLTELSYTQWEAYLAVYHRKTLLIAVPCPEAVRDVKFRRDEQDEAAQQNHLKRLSLLGRHSEIRFANADQLAGRVLRSTVLDLLVKAETNRSVSHRLRQWVLSPSFPAIVAALALPTILSAASLAPPWPSQTAIMTTVLEALGVAFAYYYLRSRPRTARFVTIASATLLAALTCLYLVSINLLTYQVSTHGSLYAKGFVCSANALLVYKEKCPNLGMNELREAGYDADQLWTNQSIAIVKMGLLMIWLSAFIMMSMLVGSFAAHSAPAAEESYPKPGARR